MRNDDRYLRTWFIALITLATGPRLDDHLFFKEKEERKLNENGYLASAMSAIPCEFDFPCRNGFVSLHSACSTSKDTQQSMKITIK